ncbi:MAG: MaoC family dehydratase N-terminal domain-containing protein [Deltaproteobacteria bacterium]|nr:MaoC family dehydratase N-terminal domain-containing protein [Deltaproteobacteria bacterium]
MAIKTDLVGKSYDVPEFTYDRRDAMIYALGIGADESDLEFLYEKHGPKVYPSFATVAGGFGGGQILKDLNIDLRMIIHGEQRVRIHDALPPKATVKTEATVAGVYDKGSNALVDLQFKSSVDGNLLFENVVSMVVRGAGGLGDHGPKRPDTAQPPDRAPDKQVKIQTEGRQALVYRLSGDWNPLHADPEIAKAVGFERPILHGLCTVGCTVRAVLRELCNNDPAAIRSIAVRFSKPVLPGDLLTAELWTEGKTVFLQTKNESGDVVLKNGMIELA